MSKPTNVLFSNGKKNPMRLILGLPGDPCRAEYDKMLDKGFEEDYAPIVIARKAEPNVWIEDDSAFILDNMSFPYANGDWPEGLNEWWDEIQSAERKVGEIFTFTRDGFTITAKIDDTPMTDLRLLEESEL